MNSNLKNSKNYPINYEDVKDKIIIRIGNEKLKEEKENVFFTRFLNLYVYYYVLVEKNNEHMKSFLVTKELVKLWEISKEDIYNTSILNTVRIFPLCLEKITDMLKKLVNKNDEIYEEISKETFNPPLYVLTNDSKIYGASAILYPDIKDTIYEILKEEYYVLPSSIHELIIVPKHFEQRSEELKEMVKTVNENEVLPEEFLSNSVYLYSKEKCDFVIA